MSLGVAARFGLLVSLVAALAAPCALAQTVDDSSRGAARQLGYSGVEAYEKGDFQTASLRLEKAYAVLRVPSLGLWSARALVSIGRLVEGRERYLEIARLSAGGGDQEVQEQAKRDAQTELEALTPRIPNLVVFLEGATPSETTVTVDGVPLASALIGEKRPTNPGRHKIEGRKGSERAEAVVEVAEGAVRSGVLRFGAAAAAAPTAAPVPVAAAPSPETAPEPFDPEPTADTSPSKVPRIVGWTLVGVGGAGLVVGAATGLMVLSTEKELDNNANCRDGKCLLSELDTVRDYNDLRGVSTVSLIAGGVLATTGVVLVLTAKSAPKPSAALVVGPGSAAIRGCF